MDILELEPPPPIVGKRDFPIFLEYFSEFGTFHIFQKNQSSEYFSGFWSFSRILPEKKGCILDPGSVFFNLYQYLPLVVVVVVVVAVVVVVVVVAAKGKLLSKLIILNAVKMTN